MNNSKKIALAIAMVCSAGAALAQNVSPQWYVQPSIVHVKPDADFGVNDRDTGGGLRFGQVVSPLWDVQIGGTHTRFDDSGARYNQSTISADALLMLSRGNVRPFVLFGIGVQRDKVANAIRNVKESSPFATAGIGFQADLTPRLAFQADLRSVRGFLNSDEAFGFKRSNNKYFAIGLNYMLNPPPAAVATTTTVATATAPVVEAPAPAPPRHRLRPRRASRRSPWKRPSCSTSTRPRSSCRRRSWTKSPPPCRPTRASPTSTSPATPTAWVRKSTT